MDKDLLRNWVVLHLVVCRGIDALKEMLLMRPCMLEIDLVLCAVRFVGPLCPPGFAGSLVSWNLPERNATHRRYTRLTELLKRDTDMETRLDQFIADSAEVLRNDALKAK
jgi:hypothetical protein